MRIKAKWCAEKEVHINPDECVNETEDCEMHCHETDLYCDAKSFTAAITYNRSLPEEDEPTTYISIAKEDLDYLPDMVSIACNKEPHCNIYLTVTNHVMSKYSASEKLLKEIEKS
jgi:hypothetical protein